MAQQEFDMLVKLYDLPEIHQPDAKMADAGIRICRPMASNRANVLAFIRANFSELWAGEFEKAMSNTPVSCFVALNPQKEILGFACYDATTPDFFGPIGVREDCRGLHIGQELLLRCLYAMRERGYAYAVIGWVAEHNQPFYHRACGAVPIPDSFPGIFRDMIPAENDEEKEA